MINRLFIALSLAIPISLLLLFWAFPESDAVWQQPLLHFYLVTFFTFAAAVVALFTAVSLGDESTPRHQLFATAFAAMGALFFVHGIMTPGAITLTFNPGIRWSAWLTLFIGGFIFVLASLDTPQRPLKLSQRHLIHWALAIFCGLFYLIVVFSPEWLTAIDEQADPWHEQVVTAFTFLFWLWAAFRLTLTWRQTNSRVDGTMALIAAWFTIGTVSLHGFPTWQLSWWIYHLQLLLGVITAVYVLISAYEKLRQFRLTYYYAAIGLVVTAALALLASHLFSTLVEQNLASILEPENLSTAVVMARLNALLIAGFSMSLFYLFMLFIVNRADRVITVRNHELAQAYTNLQAAEAMRDDLTDMVVHDLRSPLTSIKLSLDLLSKTREDEQKFDQLLGRTQTGIQRMMFLINQLLDVARLESGQLHLNIEPVQVMLLLQEKANQFSPQAEAGRKQIKVVGKADLPAVPGDRELLGRVLDNLIGNALKYTEQEGEITLQAEKNGQVLDVHVIDDGEGMAADAISGIFDKFHQVKDAEGKPRRQGTGLGLTFCKMVVDAHNGRIWVESQPGQGSKFSFSLPLKN